MKVLIVSDNHGDSSVLERLYDRHKEEAELLIHCGDSELSSDSAQMQPFCTVKGNCDFDEHFLDEYVQELDGITCYVTHGHLYNVKMSLMNIAYRAKEVKAKIVCFGHTHIAGAEYTDGILYINPGSIRLPRLRNEKTYALLELGVQEAEVRFYTDEGLEVSELSLHTQL